MLKLIQTAYGQFDLALMEPKENISLAKAKTVVYATLFSDQIAPADRVEDPDDRRGWWQAPQDGTGIWYVRRQALTESAKRETIRMIREALRTTEGMADVVVTDITPQGNVSLLLLEISGVYDGVEWKTVFKSGLIPIGQAPEGSSMWDVQWDIEWAD